MDANVREEVKDWYEGALVDLEEAKSALANGRYNWALFAAHQAVEKALRAGFMALRRARAPKTHDLVRLMEGLGLEIPEGLKMEISELSPYYTIARYPNAGLTRPWESINRGTAERLLMAAERLVKLIGEEIGLR